MKKLYISADGGGTKLNMIAFDTEGRILGSTTGGGVNVNFLSEQAVRENIYGCLESCLAPQGYALDKAYMTLVSGGGFAEDYLLGRGYTKENIRYISEGFAALTAGALTDSGCVVLAGTGSGAAVFEGERTRLHLGGYGAYIGDDGSGAWIGMKAINAVTAAVDGWGKPTALTDLLFDYLKDDNLNPGLYKHEKKGRALYAGFAKTVKIAAEQNDCVATEIMTEAGRVLAKLAVATMGKFYAGCRGADSSRNLSKISPSDKIPSGITVCPCGGVWHNGKIMLDAFDAEICKHIKTYKLVQAAYKPVYAGYIMHFLPVYGREKTESMLNEAMKEVSLF